MDEPHRLVSPRDLQARLSELASLPGGSEEGFFGPGSITWQVNRESAVFLGAGRAALLQLAHRWVAAALQQHSSLMQDAIGRFHSTIRVIYTMLFGTRPQAVMASRGLYAMHTSIQGKLPMAVGAHPAHQPYQANEVAALRWVYATLVESAILAYECVLPPLSAEHREIFYLESHRMAALCGIPPHSLPPTWGALQQYTAEMMSSSLLGVDAKAKEMGQAVLSGVGTWVCAPRWYRALTASWLTPGMRSGFGLPFGAGETRAVQRARYWLPRLYPRLPRAVRFVGPFHEAQSRLRKDPPGWWTQRSNRFWMGQPRLLHAEQPLRD